MVITSAPSSPGGHRTPSTQPYMHDASHSAGLETTLQTLGESSQIIVPIPQHSNSSCHSKDITNSSQLTMNNCAPPSLVSLPPEVQSMIVSFLPLLTDLNALSRTCKTLRGASLPKLYRRVDVRIPADHFRLDALENLLSSSGEGLKSTQQLRILPQQGPLHYNRHTNLNNDGNVEVAKDCHPGTHVSSLLNMLIRLLISKIPLNCLQWFEWRHSFPMDETTLDHLFRHQQPRCLRLKNCIIDLNRAPTFREYSRSAHILEELRFESLESSHVGDLISDLVATNFETLQHLEIGQVGDRRLSDTDDDTLTEDIRLEIAALLEESHGPLYPILSITSLTLVGLSLLALENSKARPIIDWTNLGALALKSCKQLDKTLNFLQSAIAKSDESGVAVNLKSFDLRSADCETTIAVETLEKFLTSFNGLVHLGLLLDGQRISSSALSAALKHHGPTLRRLVWDFRLQERTSFTKDPSRGQTDNKHVKSICRWCPFLEELGLSFDWPALMGPPNRLGALTKVVQCLRSLKHLRTLHIRNLPPLRPNNGEPSWPGVSDDESSEGFVIKLMRALVSLRPWQPPSLETVALGIPRYKYLCAGKASQHDNEKMDEFLKLRVYHVEYQRNFRGHYITIVTLIAKGTTDDIQDTCHNIKILQSEWID